MGGFFLQIYHLGLSQQWKVDQFATTASDENRRYGEGLELVRSFFSGESVSGVVVFGWGMQKRPSEIERPDIKFVHSLRKRRRSWGWKRIRLIAFL
jgi:hypothetical protein